MSSFRWTKRWLPAVIAGAAMCAPVFCAAADQTFPGVTKPSQQSDLSFNGPGVVSKLSVKEGDQVKAGQTLIDQDDSVEQANMAVVLVEANSDVQVDAAKAMLAYAEAELRRKQRLADEQALGASELEEAKLDVVKAQKQIELAQEEKHQKALEAEEDKAKIALKHLVSPIEGFVLKINTHVGETPSADKPVMTVVRNDPLWVETDLPTQQVKAIKLGQSLDVRYGGEPTWQPAAIIYIAPEADARSDTQKVRMELGNPTGRDSGLQVEVKVPDNLASASAK
jgi:membrane fusion protein (multidrug efflux system)